MALVAGLVDGTWYSFVSLLVGHTGLANSLVRHSDLLHRTAAGLYLIVACVTLANVTGILAWDM